MSLYDSSEFAQKLFNSSWWRRTWSRSIRSKIIFGRVSAITENNKRTRQQVCPRLYQTKICRKGQIFLRKFWYAGEGLLLYQIMWHKYKKGVRACNIECQLSSQLVKG